MAFLNPLILIASTAIAIPILIHLFSLRKVRKVEFSTLMFIKEIQKSKLKKIKLKQLLLLLFRIMLIVFLVLAFSNPVYEGYAGDAGSVRKKAIVFIDDSFSMNVKNEQGLYLEQAKEALKDILKLFNETDEVYAIPSSVVGMNEKKIVYNDFQEMLDSVNNVNSSFKSLSMNEVLNLTDELLENKNSLLNEVYIISDFQRSSFNKELTSNIEYKNLSDENVRLYLVNIGQREANNLSVDDIELKTKIIEKDKNIRLIADVTNHSKFNVFNKAVNLVVDNNIVGEKVIDIGSLETKEVEFNFRPEKSGNISGYIQLTQNEFTDDEISEDNKYYFAFYVPEIINVGIIEDNPLDSRFVRLALETAKKITSDSSGHSDGLFNVSQLRTVSNDINKYDMVFIINKHNFSANESEVINKYIERGGGVFIFPGKDIDVNNYNNVLLSSLNAFKIGKLNYIDFQDIETRFIKIKFETIDFEHPIMYGIFQNEKLSITSEPTSSGFNIESPLIKSYYPILLNDNSSPVITLSNNTVFLAEVKTLKGKILFSSVSADNDMSDFPMKSIFAPLIVRSVYYLGENVTGDLQYTLGKKNIIPVRGLKEITNLILPDNKTIQYSVTLPSSEENPVNELNSKEEIPVALSYSANTELPGFYSFKDSLQNKNFLFALNGEKGESDLQKAEEEVITDYFEEAGFENVTYISEPSSVSAIVINERKGIELWKYFLMAAFAFLLLELIYSKRLEKD